MCSATVFMTVLIVDADSLFAAQAQATLEGAGLTVVVRDDAPLDTLRKLRPRVLVVNAELPKSSGYSICNRLRRDKELQGTPILLTSAEASVDTILATLLAEASAGDTVALLSNGAFGGIYTRLMDALKARV